MADATASKVRKSWMAGGVVLGACALAGASWVYANQDAPPAAPAAKAVPALKPAAPAVPVKNAGKSQWASLSRAQQAALQPLAGEWNKLDAPRKQKWLDIANRFASMKPDEQARVHERMRDWIKLTPEQRRTVRENYARAKKIDPGQKSAQWEQYQQLPEEQKKKLAAEAVPKKVPVARPDIRPPAVITVPPVPTVPVPAPAVPVTIPAAPVVTPATPSSLPDYAR
ncbi:DUF3106 domain-containing protein [Janthinobacterium sp. J1-1]|uniref:DUF3106 domain-containing protein n=1 Tax=Janthinobacterium sp. J1-1 TaxID=3065910 RepID=UPI0028122A2A|nr:DUF3106 domain-containing protein [Janthinobacterium sp. J1-1]